MVNDHMSLIDPIMPIGRLKYNSNIESNEILLTALSGG